MALGLLAGLRYFDAYSKPLEDFRIRTWSGGVVTLGCALVIIWLTLSEIRSYITPQKVERLLVDSAFQSTNGDDSGGSADRDKVNIHFDFYLHRIPCDLLSVDAMDVSGSHQDDVSHSVWKAPLDESGRPVDKENARPERHEVNAPRGTTMEPENTSPQETTTKPACGSCYGAETKLRKCCSTCIEVRAAYREKGWSLPPLSAIDQCRDEIGGDAKPWLEKLNSRERPGCRVFGSVAVAKVAGNLHIAPGDFMREQHAHVHDLHQIGPENFNTSHRIEHLALGETFDGKLFPLDGYGATATIGTQVSQVELCTSTTSRSCLQPCCMQMGTGPSTQLSTLLPTCRTLSHLLVSLCAIVGGVYTVASLLDAAVYHLVASRSNRISQGMEKLT